jgi:hypothetical protein
VEAAGGSASPPACRRPLEGPASRVDFRRNGRNHEPDGAAEIRSRRIGRIRVAEHEEALELEAGKPFEDLVAGGLPLVDGAGNRVSGLGPASRTIGRARTYHRILVLRLVPPGVLFRRVGVGAVGPDPPGLVSLRPSAAVRPVGGPSTAANRKAPRIRSQSGPNPPPVEALQLEPSSTPRSTGRTPPRRPVPSARRRRGDGDPRGLGQIQP